MFVHSLCLCILFISTAQSSKNNFEENVQTQTNKTSDGVHEDKLGKGNFTLVSEGGTIFPKMKKDMSLPTSSFNSLTSLDEEFRKTKQKPVVARKGVDNIFPLNFTSETLLNTSENNLSATAKSVNSTVSKSTTGVETMPNSITSEVVKPEEPTPVVKKPTILSFEALADMDKKIQSEHAKLPAPSTKTFASSQIPSPNGDPIPKVYPARANSHPGMIMPVVITILVVPMFAIVGYMAIKRGQEAWKNRHYKRMDFLLDGMYND